MLLEVGQTYAGRYRIARKLGEGAMGAVYEAEHILIHRRVALKVLLPTVAEISGALHRFELEAQAAGRIGSPHIVEVLDMGDLAAPGHATARFLVMELLEGETLAERLEARGRLRAEEAAELACQLLAGLGAAHAADIVHRDLKPANVFLVRGRGGDFVKVLDFGVSKFNLAGDDMNATAPGATLGTPYYMSPEQAKGAARIDPRSDLYSVGVMLYECVTGKVPFDAGTLNELIFRIVLEMPPPIESFAPDTDPGFIALVRKAMAREPDERFQSARELHEALSQWLSQVTGQPVAPGVVPWETGAPFVPHSGSTPPGPRSEVGLDQAQTQLFVPRARRPMTAVALSLVAALGVVAGGAVLVLVARSSPEKAAVAPTASAVIAPPPAATSALPPTASAARTAAPSSSTAAVAVRAPAVTSAKSVASAPTATPKKVDAPAPAPAATGLPGQRTVPSEL